MRVCVCACLYVCVHAWVHVHADLIGAAIGYTNLQRYGKLLKLWLSHFVCSTLASLKRRCREEPAKGVADQGLFGVFFPFGKRIIHRYEQYADTCQIVKNNNSIKKQTKRQGNVV